MYTSPCSVYSNSMALAVLDKMDKQSISLDSIVSIRHPKCRPYLQPPAEEVSRPGFHAFRNWCNTAFPKATTMLWHLDRICRRHQTYQWLYPPVEYRLLQPLRKQKTACTPASRLYTAARNWSTPSAMVRSPWETADEKSCSPTRSWKTSCGRPW